MRCSAPYPGRLAQRLHPVDMSHMRMNSAFLLVLIAVVVGFGVSLAVEPVAPEYSPVAGIAMMGALLLGASWRRRA